ncbi:MAG: hypothetical protein KAR24_00600 [Candidatus Pacebacteria bacterium]|nr:hypothetical protein [Candidatus Paceibacterota bacterium]
MTPLNKRNCVSKAWLIRWSFHGSNPEKSLSELGIAERILDIVTSRKNYDKYICLYVESLYKVFQLSYSEKLSLAKYNYTKNWNKIFGVRIPKYTHYQSDVYKKLMESEHSKDGDEDLVQQWKMYPKSYILGHNPCIEAIEVFNISIVGDNNEILEWDEPIANGTRVRKMCQEGKLEIRNVGEIGEIGSGLI